MLESKAKKAQTSAKEKFTCANNSLKLSQMFDETEIKTDKYLEDIHRSEQNVIDQKPKEKLEMEEYQQEEIRLKNVKELFIK